MADHGLSADQLSVLRRIFALGADHIQSVGLFGSRATGRARPNSDIDIVVYGDLSEADLDRLRTLLDDSSLSVSVDLLAYDRIAHPPLKAHVDAVMLPLFSARDLAPVP